MTDRRGEFERSALVHLGELTRVATRLSGSRVVAEDLVQETFLQAWKSFDRFQSGTNCRAWLYKILFFVLSGHRRRDRREAVVVKLDQAPPEALEVTGELPDVLRRDRVVAAFEELPETHRVVLLLADVEELRYREIADVLEIPIGTVMSRLSRARRLLRRGLARRRADDLPVAANGKEGSR